jgi:hypothetical protein
VPARCHEQWQPVLKENAIMMNSELRYLLKTNSDCEGYTDQQSLSVLLADLRMVAGDLDLDFTVAFLEAGTRSEFCDQLPFSPCI